jgi:hypothetical protein
MTNEQINKVMEIAQAILMSAVITITAWCSYQAAHWSGIASFRLAAAHSIDIRATEKALIAEKRFMVDAIVSAIFVNAVIEGKQGVVDFYQQRLGTELGKLFKEWLATKPLENPSAPNHPLAMQEYARHIAQRYDDETKDLLRLEALRSKEAYEAKSISDAYTFKTVVLAGVLFIGGIFPNFKSLRVRIILLCLDFLIAGVSLWQLIELLIWKG